MLLWVSHCGVKKKKKRKAILLKMKVKILVIVVEIIILVLIIAIVVHPIDSDLSVDDLLSKRKHLSSDWDDVSTDDEDKGRASMHF